MPDHGTGPTGDPFIGRKVGNYRIEDRLGRGGMGTVYLARHPDLDLEVAVKVLRDGLLGSEDAGPRFLREARAATRVEHENVIRIHDFGQLPEGGFYYVMEALGGESLADLLHRRGPFSPAEALAYLEQLCPALQQAHDRGIVHRDLKPQNIFVVRERPLQLKVLDFGIAKLLDGGEAGEATAPGMLMGSPHYVSPEQAAGHSEAVGPATDLYALGVVLYTMLSGQRPIQADTPTALLYKQVTAAPVSLLEVQPSLPAAVARVVHRCLEKAPEARPGDAMELLAQFRQAVWGDEAPTEEADSSWQEADPAGEDHTRPMAGAGGVQAPPAPSADLHGQWSQSGELDLPGNRRRGWLVALALAALALAGGLFALWPRGEDGQRAEAGAATAPARPAATAPTPRYHTVTVTGGKGLTCQAWVDDTALALPDCQKFAVEHGRRLRLLLEAPGMASLDETWQVAEGRAIRLLAVTEESGLDAAVPAPDRASRRRARRRPRPAPRVRRPGRAPPTSPVKPPVKPPAGEEGADVFTEL